MARGQVPGGFDFSYILNNKVYGCCLEDEESVLIADINQESINYSGCAVSENALLLTGINSAENSSGLYLCKSDYEGNMISYTDKYSLSESNTIRKIRRKNNGELSLLVSEYNHETQKDTFYAVSSDSDLNILNRTELECEYADDFIIDDNGKIAFLSFNYKSTVKHRILSPLLIYIILDGNTHRVNGASFRKRIAIP